MPPSCSHHIYTALPTTQDRNPKALKSKKVKDLLGGVSWRKERLSEVDEYSRNVSSKFQRASIPVEGEEEAGRSKENIRSLAGEGEREEKRREEKRREKRREEKRREEKEREEKRREEKRREENPLLSSPLLLEEKRREEKRDSPLSSPLLSSPLGESSSPLLSSPQTPLLS
ncbi:hypothetical protein DUI87_06913 [Hirundo rustica rustica]|uniref:Uncharacterized protein n=1 Tax=Hirundo rustica rustica TaxID=333673 RepID=A0A3M0KNC4_HIRRU|nr:hypothetical protein DUI87_06913 [Hirundo rustica rustica]